jgi:prepilin-type N-terminal cleavage/methylation domain-containing protein
VMEMERRRQSGFTVAELMVAMIVASIILAAVATLCQAMQRGQDAVARLGQNQMKVRYAAARMAALIRSSRQVWLTDTGKIAVWKTDADDDGRIDAGELVFLHNNTAGGTIQIIDAPGAEGEFSEALVQNGLAEGIVGSANGSRLAALLTGCSSTAFQLQSGRLVILKFSLAEEAGSRDYQICVCRRNRVENGP